MKAIEIKKTLKENGALNVSVRKVNYMGKYQFGIFNWDLNQISKDKLIQLFPSIFITSNGQAWI